MSELVSVVAPGMTDKALQAVFLAAEFRRLAEAAPEFAEDSCCEASRLLSVAVAEAGLGSSSVSAADAASS